MTKFVSFGEQTTTAENLKDIFKTKYKFLFRHSETAKHRLTHVFCELRAVQTRVVRYLFFKTLFPSYRCHHINVPDVKIFNRIHSTQSLRIGLRQS